MFPGIEAGFAFVEGDQADQPVAEKQWHAQPGVDAGLNVRFAAEALVVNRSVVQDEGCPCVDDFSVGVVLGCQVKAFTQELLDIGEPVTTDDLQPVALELLDRGAVVGHDVLQLGENEFEYLLQVEGGAEGLGRCLESLGPPAGRALGLKQLGVVDGDGCLGGEQAQQLGIGRAEGGASTR